MDGAINDLDGDVGPTPVEVFALAREAAVQHAVRTARLAGRLQNLSALAAAGRATIDDQLHRLVLWLAFHTMRPTPTALMPADFLAAPRPERDACMCDVEPPAGPELTLA